MLHAENALKEKVIFEIFVLVNLQPNLQKKKKKMTEHFYDIICSQMLCKYKA